MCPDVQLITQPENCLLNRWLSPELTKLLSVPEEEEEALRNLIRFAGKRLSLINKWNNFHRIHYTMPIHCRILHSLESDCSMSVIRNYTT